MNINEILGMTVKFDSESNFLPDMIKRCETIILYWEKEMRKYNTTTEEGRPAIRRCNIQIILYKNILKQLLDKQEEVKNGKK